MIAYKELTLRNEGYIDEDLQAKIRNTRLLVAGCGVGSTIAETAVRTGFDKITLADADTVEAHNLNRQCFTANDIGTPKVEALAKRLEAVNPSARITPFNEWITAENASRLVAEADLILDTIDFLDLSAITALHDACRRQGKPIISGVSAGFGAVVIYFPPNGETSWRSVFELPAEGPVNNLSYVERFGNKIGKLKGVLEPSVVTAMGRALEVMEDGTPCPAPHVSAGAAVVGALAVTVAVRVLSGRPVTKAPRMIVADLNRASIAPGVDLSA